MAEGLASMLDGILQSLPEGSPEATKLQLVIHAYLESFEIRAEQWSKLTEDLATERKKREEAEQKLVECIRELEKLRSKP